MQLQTFAAQDSNGNVQTSPTVYIYALGTTNPISGLEDENGDPLSNPFTGEPDGRIYVAAPTGVYDMRVVKGSFDSTQVVQFIDLQDQVDAATTQANNASTSADEAAASAASAAEIVNIDEVQTFTNPLARAVRVAMTDGTSSNGWQVADDETWRLGGSDLSLFFDITLPDYTPSSVQNIAVVYEDASNYLLIQLNTDGKPQLVFHNSGTDYIAAAAGRADTAISSDDNRAIELGLAYTRETATADGSIIWTVNGPQLGSAITVSAATPPDMPQGALYLFGSNSVRTECQALSAGLVNRALSSTDFLNLAINGPSPADIGAPGNRASQVPIYESDFSAGVDGWYAPTGNSSFSGNIDGIAGEDNWGKVQRDRYTSSLYARRASPVAPHNNQEVRLRIYNEIGNSYENFLLRSAGGKPSGVAQVLVPAGEVRDIKVTILSGSYLDIVVVNSGGSEANVDDEQPFYIKDIIVKQVGITGLWSAEHAQSDTGQVFDSINSNHAMLPASGATVIGKQLSEPRQVRGTNSWDGTHELQYIGGVNQGILPDNAYIESIIGTVSGATPQDIIVGDGSDGDRYVEITTGLSTGTTSFTIANPTTDGTNLKLTVDPDANATMTIKWTITYRLLEA